MPASLLIRPATPEDAAVLASFNTAMALETEHKQLVPDVVRRGVERLLAHPEWGFYLIAEQTGQVVGSLMITTEWSDWRDAHFWWVQSVYVRPERRGQGVYRALYTEVKRRAAQENVCGFRLYVERDNERAQRTYRTLGMQETFYKVFEEGAPSA